MNLQSERLAALCAELRLAGVDESFAVLATAAVEREQSFLDYLEAVLVAERGSRRARSAATLVRMAGFPAAKTLEDYVFGFATTAPRRQIEHLATGQESLEAAQTAKYASLIDEMGAQPGDHVLEIGCGWGGFAEYAAAERGLRVTGLTISRAQHDYARGRIRRAGLDDRVEIMLQDYRDARGRYDGIASIEMFEAVGERYWPVYFDTIRERLNPGRQASLQIITVQDRRWEIYRRGVDFIQKYIFPGGMLPVDGLGGRPMLPSGDTAQQSTRPMVRELRLRRRRRE